MPKCVAESMARTLWYQVYNLLSAYSAGVLKLNRGFRISKYHMCDNWGTRNAMDLRQRTEGR